MLRYIVRRLIWVIVLLFAVSVLTFGIFFVVPADPAALAAPKGAPPLVMAQIRHRMGIDQPLWKQYRDFLHGPDRNQSGRPAGILNIPPNFGYSYQNQQSVTDILKDRFPVTMSLALGAAVLWLLMGIPIGILAALKPRSLRDRGATLFALVGVSSPTFVLGIVLLYVFYFKLHWFPSPGWIPLNKDPVGWFTHLFLAWFSLAFTNAAFYSRMVRGNMIEVQSEDFVRTARAKGLPERRVVRKHVLRASLTPVVTMLGLDVGVLLGGAIITERIFGLPGIGATAVQALVNTNLPVIVGCTLVAAFFVITLNLVVDICYAFLDPRVQYS